MLLSNKEKNSVVSRVRLTIFDEFIKNEAVGSNFSVNSIQQLITLRPRIKLSNKKVYCQSLDEFKPARNFLIKRNLLFLAKTTKTESIYYPEKASINCLSIKRIISLNVSLIAA